MWKRIATKLALAGLGIGLVTWGLVLGFKQAHPLPGIDGGYSCGTVFSPDNEYKNDLIWIFCKVQLDDRERWVYFLEATGGALLLGTTVQQLIDRRRAIDKKS